MNNILNIPMYRDGDLTPDSRVIATVFFAIGIAGGEQAMPDAKRLLVKVIDVEGLLEITSTDPLPMILQRAFRRAWSVIGYEPGENVEFVVAPK